MSIITLITTIGAVCGAIVTVVGFFTLIMKKPKKWIQDIAKQQYENEIKEVKELLKGIDEQLQDQKKATICSLRHSITGIYEKYKDEQKLPSNVREDLCSLYERYSELGGNSYIHSIFEEMIEWKSK